MRRSTIAISLVGVVLLVAAALAAAGEPTAVGSPAASTPTLTATGARGTGFWRNKNGQAIIRNRCGGEASTSLSDFLTRFRPFSDLPTTSCSAEAAYVAAVLDAATAAGGPLRAKLKAQALATALNVYFSDSGFGGNALGAPAPIGAALVDVARIARSSGWTPGTLASAFGAAPGLRVYALVAAAARHATAGGLTWYLDVRAVQAIAKDVFEAINEGRAYAPPPPAAAAPLAFAEEMRWPAGGGPAVIVSGDFNLDGRADVAVANATGAPRASVLIGLGDGSFQSPDPYSVGLEPAGLVAAELTGDGVADLAVASAGSNTVSLLWGNGDGTFRTESGPFSVGQRPAAITAADLDGDGASDLAVPNAGSGSVSVLLGDGAGYFAPTDPAGTDPQPNSVTTADLDRDGLVDLITGHASPGNVNVLFGFGGATFEPGMFFDADTGSAAVTTGDFDEDGVADLAVANTLANDVSILLNRGDGTFWLQTNEPTATPFAGGTSPVDVEVGDLNGDGHLDLATANAGSNTASILLGDGMGNFTPDTGVSVGLKPQWLALADYNGDGWLDIASANFGSNDVSVLLNASAP